MLRYIRFFFLLPLFLIPHTGRSQITLSDWTITTDSLSFQLSGSFMADHAPDTNPGLLWLAAVGSGSWINNDTNPGYTISGTIDGYDASASSPTVFSFTGNGTTNIGAYIDYGDDFGSGITFDFSDGSSNEVNLLVTITSAGKYNPSLINSQNLQLYWGGNAFSADTASAVALNLITAVPEPGTYAALAGLAALTAALAVRRRT